MLAIEGLCHQNMCIYVIDVINVTLYVGASLQIEETLINKSMDLLSPLRQ